jgi:tetratricopeptide (TPR) repeat protein
MSLEVHGEMHTMTGSILNNVGLLHLQRGNAPEAQEALRRAVAIREVVRGGRHRNTLNTRANLASAFLLGGQAALAESLAREVVRAEREIELPDAVMMGSALRTWGRTLTELERFAKAAEPLLDAYALQEKALGITHDHTQRDAEALAELYGAWGREAVAAEWRGRLRAR